MTEDLAAENAASLTSQHRSPTIPKPILFTHDAESLEKIVLPSTKHMDPEERQAGIETMLDDLYQLASRDGCIAAAWALELAREVARLREVEQAASDVLASFADYERACFTLRDPVGNKKPRTTKAGRWLDVRLLPGCSAVVSCFVQPGVVINPDFGTNGQTAGVENKPAEIGLDRAETY